jgi:hypothetical protein
VRARAPLDRVEDDEDAHVRLQAVAHQRAVELVLQRRDHAQARARVLADLRAAPNVD